MEINISVRGLVEFIMRSGDIDNRRSQAPENAMQEGGRIHRMIQGGMGPYYHAEVPLKYKLHTESYDLVIDGRADGIEDKYFGKQREPWALVLIDEIKGTYRELARMKEAVPVHEAQAKCYAYIYALQNGLDQIRVRITYCNIDTEEKKLFEKDFSFEELERWFQELVIEYRKWSDYTFSWNEKRTASIKQLVFPYTYREGQKELATYVYQTIYHRRKLFIEAPTGVGKTLSTVFPSVKAVGEGKAEKIFYLTAKTITRTVAEEAFNLLRERGLAFKTVTLTAKDKICFCEEPECNPDACPYAKGHFDRVNDCLYEFITQEERFDRERVEAYARRYRVCPFEMCLDMSLFADAVICDYNYVFDPHVYLRRFFGEGEKREYLFLIDEAHNLVDRGRGMYSATLKKEDFLALKRTVKGIAPDVGRKLEKCNRELLERKRECAESRGQGEGYRIEEDIASFVNSLNRLVASMDKFLEENEGSPVQEELLEFYFQVSHFLYIYELLDENYVIYTEMEPDNTFLMRLLCVNPSVNLASCMERARSVILFSATLLPIQYYKNLLGGNKEDYEVYAHSIFDPASRGLFIGRDVTSRYARRSDAEYYRIAAYIDAVIKQHAGNYMVFCPSHLFLENVYTAYTEHFQDTERVECLLQEAFLQEEAREAFLQRFRESKELTGLVKFDTGQEKEKSLVGFCVMGGIFSEGIDLKNDSLIGAIIVGTGVPQVCNEREILKQHFEKQGENGFDYAYRYPGMNKVLQAAGRVIRTEEDLGVVALLDERFLQPAYQKMFPREWEHFETATVDRIGALVKGFWERVEG